MEVSARKTEAGSTQRRHEGGCNGHSGEHRALVLAALLEYSRETAEEGNQNIINRRVCPRKELGRIVQAKRGDQEVQEGSHETDAHHHEQVLSGSLHQVEIIDAQTEAKAENRSHQRGYEHRTDDDRNGVDIEAY